MVIRPAILEDIDQVGRLWLEMVKEIYPDFEPNAEWWRDMCRGLMNMGIYHLFIAEDQGKAIGFIDGMVYPEPSTGKIHGVGQHFYILPEYRGTTTAMKLYRSILKLAKGKGVQVFEFFCTPDNTKFWEKKGYRIKRIMMRRAYV